MAAVADSPAASRVAKAAAANPPLRVIELLRYKLMDESVSRGILK